MARNGGSSFLTKVTFYSLSPPHLLPDVLRQEPVEALLVFPLLHSMARGINKCYLSEAGLLSKTYLLNSKQK